MYRVVDVFFKSPCQQLLAIPLLVASSLVWGEGSPSVVAGVDEPREVTGFIIGAIIFNITLVIVFLALLRKEWNKNKAASKPALKDKCEGK